MNRLKKVMSIILTTVIVLGSCLCVASANEVITVTYWNADSTKIMVDLSTEVSESDLKGAVSLTLGGEPVNIESVTEMPSTPKASGGMAASSDYSYVIIPEDGIAFDSVYNIKIDSSLLGAEYNKHFSVEKLWKEDFESDNYTSASFPWKDVRSKGTLTLEAENENNFLKIVTQGQSNYSAVLPNSGSEILFADTGVAANTYWASGSEAALMTDYNIELKIKVGNHTTNGEPYGLLRLCLQSHNNRYPDSNYQVNYLLGGAEYNGNKSSKTLYAQANNTSKVVQGAGGTTSNQAAYITGVTAQSNPFSATEYTPFSISAKGNNIKVFADEAFANYNHTVAISAYGVPDLVTYGSSYLCVDDIIATKMTEYKKAEYTISPTGDDVEIGDEVIISFQKPVDEATLLEDNIEIYKDGVPFYGYSVNPGDKPENAVIKFDMPFEYKTTYTIAPKGIAFLEDSNNYFFDKTSFTTEPFPYELTDFAVEGDPNMSFLNKGTYNVSATFNNHKIAEGMDVIVSICLFDENLKMIDMNIKEMSLEMGEKDNITDTWTIDTRGKYIAKCFVWDSLEGMVSIITQTIE